MKHKPHIFTSNQFCWQRYKTHPFCQPVFLSSAFLKLNLALF
jgi:hypothetical protein